MGLQERIGNLKLIVKNDRRVWFIAGFLALLFVLYSLSNDKPKYRTQPALAPTAARGEASTLGGKDGTKELISTYGWEIQNIKDTLSATTAVIDRNISDTTRDRQAMQGVIESVVDRLTQIDRNFAKLDEKVNNLNSGSGYDGSRHVNSGYDSLSGPEIFGLEAPQGPPPLPPRPLKMTVITPGDSVAVKLLTGVNAPVDGTPYPVLFQINSPITGPDGSFLDVGEARIIAAATGSETDSRALFRLNDLAIRHKDGRRSVVQIDGWIVGEDGIRGMRGTLIDKLGRLIAATAGVSGTAALGEGLLSHLYAPSGSNVTAGDNSITITNNDLSYAGAKALTDASNRLGQVLLDRYEKLVPVVEVLSGREVAAVFSQPAEIEIFDESDESIYDSSVD